MLTGKDVWEVARPNIVKYGFEDLEWEDFVPEAQEFYVELAARLNEVHIAPLQGLAEELQSQNRKLATEVKVLRESDRALFDAQEAMIDALKSLVKDYHAALKDAHERKLNVANAFSLEKRMRVLLAEQEQ